MGEVILKSDVPAISVPYGEVVTIPKGASVYVGRRLGGHFTVTWSGGTAQIRGEHAEALGQEIVGRSEKEDSHKGPPDMDEIWRALKNVFDPEIPVNIVDLGLVYSVDIVELDAERFGVKVAMTLTAPGCGMGPAIAQDARMRLEEVPGVGEAAVDIVWDPPWNQEMISEEGKMELGLI
jgi:probable FeS assembly SUF system protein SufT